MVGTALGERKRRDGRDGEVDIEILGRAWRGWRVGVTHESLIGGVRLKVSRVWNRMSFSQSNSKWAREQSSTRLEP